MKTFTVERQKGVRLPSGRMGYLFAGREYKIDGRRKGFFDQAQQIVSQDIYDKVVGVEPEEVDFDAEETNEEED